MPTIEQLGRLVPSAVFAVRRVVARHVVARLFTAARVRSARVIRSLVARVASACRRLELLAQTEAAHDRCELLLEHAEIDRAMRTRQWPDFAWKVVRPLCEGVLQGR